MKNVLKLILLFLFSFSASFSQIELINTGTNNDLMGISVMGQVIFINGKYEYLAKSYDGCNNLIVMSKPSPPNYVNGICPVDTSLIFMLSGDGFANASSVYKSTDGGMTWTLNYDTIGFSAPYLLGLNFFDSNFGISLATSYRQLTTSDGGNTWTLSNSPWFVTSVVREFGDSVIIVGGAGSGTGMHLSRNRGISWKATGPALGTPLPFDFFFVNKDTILGVTDYSQITFYSCFLRSFNGGGTWDCIPVYGDPPGIYPPVTMRKLCIRNVKEIYAAGWNLSNEGIIMKSADIGQTWSSFNTGIKALLYDMKFINDSIALVCGSNGTLFRWNSRKAIFTGLEKNGENDPGFSIYPNPVKDRLQIRYNGLLSSGINLKIINTLGQTVFLKQKVKQNEVIDVRTFAPGIYYLTPSQEGVRQRVYKVVKE